ncbi:hypothetical protein [Paenibacillus montanisoli]|uniref:hypothetical protein n=1 Tax=Paenibacillus montanisoli TaxID=2081970 RepID=UPI001401BC73|nr:hypothetical protein [Paenibacillus montanisoli]
MYWRNEACVYIFFIRIDVVTGKSRKGFEISSRAMQLSEYWGINPGDDVERP